jgi:hypothetical protein
MKLLNPLNCIVTNPVEAHGHQFYIIFVILVKNVMLNLFILVIIQKLETYYVSDDNPIQNFKDNLSVFMDVSIEFTSI